MKSLLSSATVLALATFSLQLRLSAASAVWNVTTGGDFATGSNWNPAAAPGNTSSGATSTGDVATLGKASGGTINVDAGRTVRFLNIGAGTVAGPYTFSGGTLYLSSPGGSGTTAAVGIQILNTVTSSAIQTIDLPVVVAAVGGPAPTGVQITNRSTGSGLLNFTSNATITSSASGPVNLRLEGANTGNNTIAGVISDGSGASTLGIRKDNTGTWILTGANSYTGGTSVIGGKLFINGNQTAATGAVIAGNLATLGGSGTIGGATTLNGGSLLIVGASTSAVGTLSFASSLNMGGTSATLKIGGTVAGQFDRIDVTGNLTYGGALQIVDFTGFDISGQPGEYQIFGIGASQSGDLGSVNVDSVALTPNLGVWTATAGGFTYAFDQSTGRLAVTVNSGTVFDNWMATNYPQIPNGSNGPNDDADNDGAINLTEFGFGGNPADGSDNAKFNVFKADSAGNTKLVLTISVRAGTPAFSTDVSPVASHDGIRYAINGSLDLQSFATKVNPIAPVVPLGMPDAKAGYEYRSFSLEGSEGLPGRGFIRASVVETTN